MIKYYVLDGTVRETQLFNLVENPYEFLAEHHDSSLVELSGSNPKPHQVNLAGDSKHAEKLLELEALLFAEQQRLDDPFQLWDQPE